MDTSKAEAARYIAEVAIQLGGRADDHGMRALADRLFDVAIRASDEAGRNSAPALRDRVIPTFAEAVGLRHNNGSEAPRDDQNAIRRRACRVDQRDAGIVPESDTTSR